MNLITAAAAVIITAVTAAVVIIPEKKVKDDDCYYYYPDIVVAKHFLSPLLYTMRFEKMGYGVFNKFVKSGNYLLTNTAICRIL